MESSGPSDRAQVIIVGAGPTGLALAIELGGRGVGCLLMERNERAGWAPRAKTTHTRTREHLRRWGISGKLAEASPFGVDYPSHITFVTKLAGPGITRFEHALQCAPERNELYAEHGQWIPQYKLEAVLLEHALTLPSVTIAFGQEFLSFDQDEHAVRVQVRDVASGGERSMEGEYLVGADGARSGVREALGATMPDRDPWAARSSIGRSRPTLALRSPAQLSIPVMGGRLALGTWQGLYLFEHRRRPHRRSIALHVIGE